MAAQHTPGPWRWEFNRNGKQINLVGGVPTFDLTVMDFVRWGMGSAVPRFRDVEVDGMNLMDRVCDKPEWFADFPGRSHHAHWCSNVIHPDAMLIAAAPDLLEALKKFADYETAMQKRDDVTGMHLYAEFSDMAYAAIKKAVQ